MATEMDHQIVKDLKAAGIDYITSVPCKQLAGVIEVLDETPEIMHMPSNKEDEGMGL